MGFKKINEYHLIDAGVMTGTGGSAESTDITAAADTAGNKNSTWFNLYSANDATHYYVWLDNGTGVDPAVPGATGVQVVYSNGDTANTIAGLIRTALGAVSDFTITGATSHIIVTNIAIGATTNASNGTASPGFSYSVVTPGANNLSITSSAQNVSNFDNIGLQIEWTGSAVGTITVQGSVDEVTFYDLTFSPSLTQPAGTAGGYLVNINQFPWPFLRVHYVNTSSTGVLDVFIFSKDLN